MTDEQTKRWNEIVDRCGRMVQCTVGSAPRRQAVLAVDAELRRLRRRVAELESDKAEQQVSDLRELSKEVAR